MEAKVGVEEKRVKSTIIRRRAKAEESVPASSSQPILSEEDRPETAAGVSGQPVATPQEAQGPATSVTGQPGSAQVVSHPIPVVEETTPAKEKPRKPARRKSRDELEMEMLERAGGLKKAAEILEVAPERLERVFRPDRSGKKKKILSRKEFKHTELTTPRAIKRVIRMEGTITVADLAKRMSVKAGEILKKLMGLGMMATINQVIDTDTAVLVAHDFGFEVENVAFSEASMLKTKETEEKGDQLPRSPIVTVMGHVDHGKTSLLDRIRKAQVAEGEAGGITQHIGAYDVVHPKGAITFIDTPGHEAFTAMRARGAKVTDIVVLVVAADDGVMPQTIEAVHHAKAANVPIIVAVNKIDKAGADPARVERGLMEHGLVSEKLGGDVIFASVSAKTGQGIEELLEMILLQAEVLDLKADPSRRAMGTIIEARLDKGRGPVATVIIQAGTLHLGDVVVAGIAYGKVRALLNAQGQNIEEAGPSKPVEVLGLSSIPLAGDTFHATESEEDARQVAEHREKRLRDLKQAQAPMASLEDLYAKAAQEIIPELRLIIKGDVHGSIEALKETLTKLSTEKVRVMVLHAGVGAITESDVTLAVASRAIIIGFNMRPDVKARQLAESERIQIRSYNIIYDVVDDIKKAMGGLLKPTYQEKYLGRAEVRQIFTVSKIGTIAGTSVLDGKILRTARARVLRDAKTVYEGKISSLKRFKDDAREVSTGLECGIGIENFNDLKIGDLIETFIVEEIASVL